MRARARLIAALAAHVGLPVRRILEAGCGTGLLRAALLHTSCRARTTSALESSAYLCRRYGWRRGRIESYRARAPFDLRHLLRRAAIPRRRSHAERALANFARLTRGLLYFSALTRGDFARNCDRARTDADVHLRSARWYRTRLRRHFREAGLGFWVRRGAPLTLWELESQ